MLKYIYDLVLQKKVIAMKKTVIILLIIIIVSSIILAYKIISSQKEGIDIADANIYDEYTYDTYYNSEKNYDNEKNIIIQKQPNTNNNQPIQTEVVESEQNRQILDETSSNHNNYQSAPQTSTENAQKKTIATTNTNNTYVTQPKEEVNLDYVAQMNTKIRNQFKGYGNNNIYWLENGSTFIQTDSTWERKTLNNPNVELRYYVGSKQYKLYVEGMKTDVQVASLNARKGTVVFPQQEYSKYNRIVQGLAGSGTINSSSTKPYFDKLNDIKNNWTKLGHGKVICVSGTSYWEQIDSSVGTFKENAEVIVGSYNNNNYMLIDGISEPILVKNYQI